MEHHKKQRTVQLIPEKVFFVLRDKFGYGASYKAIVPALPFVCLLQPVSIRGEKMCLCLHKDHVVSKLLLLNHPSPFKKGDAQSPKDLQSILIMKVFGGKESGFGTNRLYRNELYFDVRVKANSGFDPSHALSVVMGEFALRNMHKPLPEELELPIHSLRVLEPYTFDREDVARSVTF